MSKMDLAYFTGAFPPASTSTQCDEVVQLVNESKELVVFYVTLFYTKDFARNITPMETESDI